MKMTESIILEKLNNLNLGEIVKTNVKLHRTNFSDCGTHVYEGVGPCYSPNEVIKNDVKILIFNPERYYHIFNDENFNPDILTKFRPLFYEGEQEEAKEEECYNSDIQGIQVLYDFGSREGPKKINFTIYHLEEQYGSELISSGGEGLIYRINLGNLLNWRQRFVIKVTPISRQNVNEMIFLEYKSFIDFDNTTCSFVCSFMNRRKNRIYTVMRENQLSIDDFMKKIDIFRGSPGNNSNLVTIPEYFIQFLIYGIFKQLIKLRPLTHGDVKTQNIMISYIQNHVDETIYTIINDTCINIKNDAKLYMELIDYGSCSSDNVLNSFTAGYLPPEFVRENIVCLERNRSKKIPAFLKSIEYSTSIYTESDQDTETSRSKNSSCTFDRKFKNRPHGAHYDTWCTILSLIILINGKSPFNKSDIFQSICNDEIEICSERILKAKYSQELLDFLYSGIDRKMIDEKTGQIRPRRPTVTEVVAKNTYFKKCQQAYNQNAIKSLIYLSLMNLDGTKVYLSYYVLDKKLSDEVYEKTLVYYKDYIYDHIDKQAEPATSTCTSNEFKTRIGNKICSVSFLQLLIPCLFSLNKMKILKKYQNNFNEIWLKKEFFTFEDMEKYNLPHFVTRLSDQARSYSEMSEIDSNEMYKTFLKSMEFYKNDLTKHFSEFTDLKSYYFKQFLKNFYYFRKQISESDMTPNLKNYLNLIKKLEGYIKANYNEFMDAYVLKYTFEMYMNEFDLWLSKVDPNSFLS